MPKSTIWLDVDETLLYSRYQVPNSIFFDFQGEKEFTCPRPSSWEFLASLKDKGYNLSIITQGNIIFQEAALEASGLLLFFHELYGYVGDISHVKAPEEIPDRWLLVDNQSSRSSILAPKREWLKSQFEEGKNFLRCEDWLGEYDTQPLTELLPQIYRILR